MTGSRSKASARMTLRRPLSTLKSLASAMARAAPPQAPDEAVERRRRLGVALLQRRAHDRRQVADILGDQEVVLHEAFDVGQPRPGRIAELTGDRPLDVEAEALLGAAGEKVEPASHRPQEFLATAKQRELARRKQPGRHQLMRVAHAIDVFGDPEQCVEIAQSALAVLDVRLDQIARRPGPADALLALGELGGDEFGRGPGDDLLVEPGPQRLEQRPVPAQESRLDQSGADRHVGAGLLQALLDRAGRMADLQLHVPQDVKQRLDRLLDAGGRLGRHQKQEIDVRPRRQHAAPVSADRDDGERRPALLRGGAERARAHVERDDAESRPSARSALPRRRGPFRPPPARSALRRGLRPALSATPRWPRGETRRRRLNGVSRSDASLSRSPARSIPAQRGRRRAPGPGPAFGQGEVGD